MATFHKRRRKSDGAVRYQAKIRISRRGQIIYSESKTFGKLAMAKEWARGREEQLSMPGAMAAVQHRGVTVGDLIGRYIAEMEQIKTLGRTKLSALKQLSGADIAQQDAIEIEPQHIIDHARLRRLDGVGPATVEQDIVWLRVVFKYARRAWGVPLQPQVVQDASDTLREAHLIAKPRRRRRRPTYSELMALDDYFSGNRRSGYQMRLIMWLAIYSARRQDELCRIMRADMDKKHGSGWLRDVKHPDGSAGNDKEFVLPAPGWQVVDAILDAVPSDDGRLLPFDSKTVSAYFTRACHMLGIDDLHFHDLRHECLSRLAEDGYTIPQLQQVSLHDSWSSLQVYVNLQAGKKQNRFDFAG